MRKLLALILLAGVATPAIAAGDRPGRHQESGTQATSEDRADHSEDRADHSVRQHFDRGNRGGNDGGSQSQPASQATHSISSGGGNSTEHRSNFEFRGRSGGGDPQPATQVESSGGGGNEAREPRFHHGFVSRASSGDRSTDQPTRHDTLRGTIGNVRSGESTPSRGPRIIEAPQDRGVSDLREQRRSVPAVFRNRVPIVSSTPHEGTQPPKKRIETRRTNWVDWSTSHWRNDRKYDWKDHRRRHRSLFHLGFYYDPFGWNYRPYQIGWRLWPSYYSSNFWLNDPWQYRLPYAPPGYRWIRYYDDAILVDTWDGRVVDVIYNFFW